MESQPTSRPFRERPCALRFPCECFRERDVTGQRSGLSAPCPRESIQGEGARFRWKYYRADLPRSARRKGPVALFPYNVRTSGYLCETEGQPLPHYTATASFATTGISS